VVTVSTGNICRDALNPEHRFVSLPLHVRNPDGSRGMARRQCTSEYKIKPLKAAARRMLGYPTREEYPPASTPSKPSRSPPTSSTAPKTPTSPTYATSSR